MADEEVADLLDEALETAKNPREKESDKGKDKKKESPSKSRERSKSRDRRSSRRRDARRSRGREKRRSRSRRSRSRRRRSRRRSSSSRGRKRGRERERERDRRGKREASSPSRRGRTRAISPESMPKGGEKDAGGEEEDKKKKKSKWDEVGDTTGLPDWLQDLAKKDNGPSPPGIDPARFKIIRMEGVQIRALIGKGGETIKEIRLRSGADIKIDHLPSDPEGNVTIVGEVEKTEAMIKEALQTKGCPLLNKPGAASPLEGLHSGPAGHPPPLQSNEQEVTVPADVVSLLVANGGATIKEIREKSGGQVFISLLPPKHPGADQVVRLVGASREYAKQLLLEKVDDLKEQARGGLPGGTYPARPKAPGMGLGLPAVPMPRPVAPMMAGMPYGVPPPPPACFGDPSLGGCGLPAMASGAYGYGYGAYGMAPMGGMAPMAMGYAAPPPVPGPGPPGPPPGMGGTVPARAPAPPSFPSIAAPPPPEAHAEGRHDFNAVLREAARAAEATIGMNNTPKSSTPPAGVPLL